MTQSYWEAVLSTGLKVQSRPKKKNLHKNLIMVIKTALQRRFFFCFAISQALDSAFYKHKLLCKTSIVLIFFSSVLASFYPTPTVKLLHTTPEL